MLGKWYKTGAGQLVVFVVAAVVSGVVGYYSAILAIKGELSGINREVGENRIRITEVVEARLGEIQTLRSELLLHREAVAAISVALDSDAKLVAMVERSLEDARLATLVELKAILDENR